MNIRFKKGMKLKDLLFIVIVAGVAAHASLWLINESAEVFYESSVYKLTGHNQQLEK